ncbi:hypothetical protein [Pyruvatibacter mobilis]|uniref:hypothetical protein n=1 Tax=Pyruvatibacter mobilis TaxID=1712261 RepID=UPI003BA8FECC
MDILIRLLSRLQAAALPPLDRPLPGTPDMDADWAEAQGFLPPDRKPAPRTPFAFLWRRRHPWGRA